MARRRGPFATDNPWRSIALQVCFWLTAVAGLIGFVVLPIADRARGEPVWAAICSAFGLKSAEAPPAPRPPPRYASDVRWTPGEIEAARGGDPRRGAFVALNCLACHGERGVNASGWIPNLAGLRRETTVKQLLDYRSGHRVWGVMNGIGQALSRDDIDAVAAYFAGLPPAAMPIPPRDPEDDPALRLIDVGDAGRGIAPCGACHGLSGLKRAAPALNGQQPSYLARQLRAFRQDLRRNDEGEQMRVLARGLTDHEIEVLSRELATRH